MPVKAAVFGHNVPLKTVVNSKGVAAASREWPLDGVTSVTAAMDISASTLAVDLSLAVGGVTYTATVKQPAAGASTAISLGNQTVTVTQFVGGELISGCQVVFPLTTISLDTSGRVVVDTAFDHQLATGQTVVASTGAKLVEAELDGSTLRLCEELPLPVSDLKVLTLDSVYDQIVPGSWLILRRPSRNTDTIHQVAAVRTISVAQYGMTGRVTQLTLVDAWLDSTDLALSDIRDTSVRAATHPLMLADSSIDSVEEPVAGDRIELDKLYDGLQSGRWLIVTGARLDIPGTSAVTGTELAMLADVEVAVDQSLPGDVLHTRLVLANPLAYVYKRDTVVIYGNVAHATQGETRTQVLGSGDGSVAGQRFGLSQSPLTFVSASNPAGVESTLQVRVNEVLWHETQSLAALGPTDHRFITSTDDKDKTTIIVGDGDHGARLPTGRENVRAVYRTGIGKSGNVGARRISLLATKPLGVKTVVNPLLASGGADRESRDSGRRNAPLAVMALDRLVSVQDYADFARTFAGIGKAAARRLSDGRQQVVHVTVAGDGDIPIAPTSDLYRNLQSTLRDFGDPFEPVRLATRELVELVISARVRVQADYAWEFVEPRLRSALLDALGFDRREIGQAVELSEVVSLVQQLPGVDYVDVDVLAGVPESITTDALGQLAQTLVANPSVPARLAERSGFEILPAQIVCLKPDVPDTLILREIRP